MWDKMGGGKWWKTQEAAAIVLVIKSVYSSWPRKQLLQFPIHQQFIIIAGFPYKTLMKN